MNEEIKAFIIWLCDIRCPFSVHYNGIDKTKDRISFDKGSKNYSLDEVFQFWMAEFVEK